MNEVNLPAIEPVTDEDVRAAVRRGEIAVAPFLQQALEQDRRRVAERQAPEIERLRAELEEANERAAGLGEESARFRAEVALRNSEVELFRGELKRRCDEVAQLTAAQATMIDATGAVETGVFWYSGRYVVEIPKSMALSRVLIVPVRP